MWNKNQTIAHRKTDLIAVAIDSVTKTLLLSQHASDDFGYFVIQDIIGHASQLETPLCHQQVKDKLRANKRDPPRNYDRVHMPRLLCRGWHGLALLLWVQMTRCLKPQKRVGQLLDYLAYPTRAKLTAGEGTCTVLSFGRQKSAPHVIARFSLERFVSDGKTFWLGAERMSVTEMHGRCRA